MAKRILHMVYNRETRTIFAGDFDGRIHELDIELNHLRSSDPLPRATGLYVIITDGPRIYARDFANHLITWDAKTLRPEHFLHLEVYGDGDGDGPEPIPTVTHGLHIWEDKILVNDAFGKLLQFNRSNLAFERRLNFDFDGFVEAIDTTVPGHDVVTDCAGNVYLGDLSSDIFAKVMRLDHGPIHRVRYDVRNDRYWMTTDGHGGVSLVNLETKCIQRVYLTNDDTEWVELSSDGKRAYVACFDHHLHILENGKEPRLLKKIGPFKFQLKQVMFVDDNHVVVLLESGELFLVDRDGAPRRHDSVFGTNCIWDLEADFSEPGLYHCPLEDGGFATVALDKNTPIIGTLMVAHRVESLGHGRMRRIKSLPGGDLIGAFTDGSIERFDRFGHSRWCIRLDTIVRDLAVGCNSTIGAAVSEAGEVVEIDLESGTVLWSARYDKPLWAVAFLDDLTLVFSERMMNYGDQGTETTSEPAYLYRLDRRSRAIVSRYANFGNIKRITAAGAERILINGNGQVGTQVFDLEAGKTVSRWDDWQLNTCEDAIFVGEQVHTVTYGYQLNTYEKDGAIKDSQFSPNNYPKAIKAFTGNDGNTVLLVAGRGGFVSLYRIKQGIPYVMQTLYVE